MTDENRKNQEGPTRDDSPGGESLINDLESFLDEITDQIGPYKILSRLGEGGFGVVYDAEQESPIRRRVALKVIKPGMDSKQVIARFEAERQALALMNHPNIAKVFDAGLTEHGRPYFVMEKIKGEPITDFCDRHEMSIKKRLELMIPVCQAIQHAHAKGIIHRDIKPSNILVGYNAEGHAKPTVIDFGVAKALNQRLTEKTLFTSQGQLIGTPEYMSPEQAENTGLDIDIRSDVYSLGVVLYELLTGVLPLDPTRLRSALFGEIRRIIREEEPQRPSTRLSTSDGTEEDNRAASKAAKDRDTSVGDLPKNLRGELDWVVMKCLEKDRDRRYPTADALKVEINRYLEGMPVLARPPSVSYMTRKLILRHKSEAFVATVIVLSVLLSVVVMFFAWRGQTKMNTELQVAISDRDKALVEAQQSEEAAISARDEARNALDLATKRLGQIQSFVQIYSDYEQQIRRIEGATAARTRLAESTISVLDQMSLEAIGEPWIERELADGYLSVGLINAVRSEAYKETARAFQQATDLYRGLRDASPTEYALAIGEVQSMLGFAASMIGNGQFADSILIAQQAEELARSIPDDDQWHQSRHELIAKTVLLQAKLKLLGQQFESAERLVQSVIGEQGSENQFDSSSPVVSLDIASNAHRMLAMIYREQGGLENAIAEYRTAIRVRSFGVEHNANDAVLRRGLISDLNELGKILAYDARSPKDAVPVYRESLVHAERLRQSDPLDGRAYELVLDQRKALGDALRRGKFFEKALVESELSLQVAQEYASLDPVDRLRQRRVTAAEFSRARAVYEIALRTQDDAQSKVMLEQSIDQMSNCSLFYRDLTENNPLGSYDKFKAESADVEMQLAKAIESLGKKVGDPMVYKSAIDHYLKSAEIYSELQADGELASDQVGHLSVAYRNVATILISIPEPDGEQAVRYFELADRILKKDHWKVYARKADAYRLIGDAQTCRDLAQQAFDAVELQLPEDRREAAKAKIQGVLDELVEP